MADMFPLTHKTFPQRMDEREFYRVAYPYMFASRRIEESIEELFQKGYVKGTVTQSIGHEALEVSMALPFRVGTDMFSLLHRGLPAHLVLGSSPTELFNQYLTNAGSLNHGKEPNVHHGDVADYRFPMMSHLGAMLAPAVGATWQKRKEITDTLGLAVIGDGGTSTGDFHESLNLASIFNVPVLYIIENNNIAFSTPTKFQYRCNHLSDRAQGYGIEGLTIDGSDPWLIYTTVCDSLGKIKANPNPFLLEVNNVTRLRGHAVYDKREYLTEAEKKALNARDPLRFARKRFVELTSEDNVKSLEAAVEEEVKTTRDIALRVPRPVPQDSKLNTYFEPKSSEDEDSVVTRINPVATDKPLKNGEAVNLALRTILKNDPHAILMGMDVGVYGSAFKTCKGLFELYGRERVIDMPISESGNLGFALGATQTGAKVIFEDQFADFATEHATQLLNAATWYFRTQRPAPLLLRMPCGSIPGMGPFHSAEVEGLWSRIPGVKALYPATAQETFEALIAGYYDPNPVVVFEHKGLYWGAPGSGKIDFDGDLKKVWRPRIYTQGNDVTVVAIGAMVHEALKAQQNIPSYSLEIINPFVLSPLEKTVMDPLIESVKKTGRLVVVEESSEQMGIGEKFISTIGRAASKHYKSNPFLIAAPNMPVPAAPELENWYRPNHQRIEEAVQEMMWE
jgi:2-oxoisovalerate dehydrogenase E1 component